MGLSRTVSEIYGDFSRKSQNFPTPFYFASPMKEFPLELGTAVAGVKNKWWGTGPTNKFDDIFSHLDRMHQRDRQTDGRADTGPQQRPRLRIASRAAKTRERVSCAKTVKYNWAPHVSIWFYCILPPYGANSVSSSSHWLQCLFRVQDPQYDPDHSLGLISSSLLKNLCSCKKNHHNPFVTFWVIHPANIP